MWKLTLVFNIFILFLFWLLSWVAITPAYNLLVQYGDAYQVALPIFTDLAIQFRSYTALIPLAWVIVTFVLGTKMSAQDEGRRNEWLLAHTSLTLCIGLSLFLFYLLSGILPILKIGAVL